MPGPNSQPHARTASGHVVVGKSAMRRLKLRSRENERDYDPALAHAARENKKPSRSQEDQ